jgi:hypothetical protein
MIWNHFIYKSDVKMVDILTIHMCSFVRGCSMLILGGPIVE